MHDIPGWLSPRLRRSWCSSSSQSAHSKHKEEKASEILKGKLHIPELTVVVVKIPSRVSVDVQEQRQVEQTQNDALLSHHSVLIDARWLRLAFGA